MDLRALIGAAAVCATAGMAAGADVPTVGGGVGGAEVSAGGAVSGTEVSAGRAAASAGDALTDEPTDTGRALARATPGLSFATSAFTEDTSPAAPLLLAQAGALPLALRPDPSPEAVSASSRPKARRDKLPNARWGKTGERAVWTRAVLSSLNGHASRLPEVVPADIAAWCPAYPDADRRQREAFWVGLVSTLARHESTYRPRVIGGGGRWHGLLQILPSTARLYGCRADTGAALLDGSANLSCGLRIMARTVARDGVVSDGMRGVAADWGPFHSSAKRGDMMAWTRKQTYCQPIHATRPTARPSEGL
ncbi:transglycosylase SLT domain-containing protein [Roseivivax sp.]